MILKHRTVSDELRALRSLDVRMELTPKERYYMGNLEKGYEGELKFDRMAESLQEERYIIDDLLLEVNNSYFQLDKLIISQGTIHLIDIKNFDGDYYLLSDKLYSKKTDKEYKNPILQLNRSTTLFRQLLQSLNQNYLIESYVIFINPEFTLYQAPMDQPMILPTQVNRYIKELNNTNSKLNDGHKKLAQTLVSLHQTKNPFTKLPEYTYDKLKKGFFCKICNSFYVYKNGYGFVCGTCGEYEKIEQAILRNVEEFKLLFPERKITIETVYEWCNADLSKRTFARVLKKNYTVIGNTSGTYYQ